ncbi:MAG TPA: DNA polymerase Y family protein [Casimicrobiaceae bacterium]|nr:DNA polymerase Y family protein [Casimicrobiaceae bacterium]
MLWTCLHFPDLPLRIFARAGMREIPSVVSTASHRPDVLVANGAAQKRGIVSGMSIAAALGLDPDVAIHLRDECAEASALKNIALWAGQWTSTIAIEPPANVLLEISGCLNYFGGLSTLLGRIDAGLAAIGFSALVATAPTAPAASLLARAGRAIAIEEGADIDSALAALPVGLLDGADEVMDTLWGIGVRTVGDVLALPRDGFARRFGASLLDQIDRARGSLPDARALFVAPERYHGQLELPSPVEETEALLFAVRRLVVELAGFLHGRGAGVTRMRFDLVHEDVPPTSIVIRLAATRQIEHMQNVLRERLSRLQLPDRVEAIRLVSEETAPLAGKEGELFQGSGKDGEAGTQLVERLRARLGEGSVYALALQADHRPERAQASTQAGLATKGAGKDPRSSSPVRPLWLFAEPRPLGAEPASAEMKLLSGPERIESGWWDEREIGRDYFIGRDAQGAEVWLYRDRGGQWFVQGVFA